MLMIARFNSSCHRCGAAIRKGDEIQFVKATRSVQCAKCTEQAEPDLARMFDMAYEDQCADACGPGL